MKIFTFLFILLGGVFLLLILRLWQYFQKERLRRIWLEDHLGMLNRGVEDLTEEAPSLMGDPPLFSPDLEIRRLWGDPPDREKVLEEIAASEAPGGGWDFEVHLHEGAEAFLGSVAFNGLAERFESIPGVEAVGHEDREVFRIRARGLSADDLRKLLWGQFLKAAGEVREREIEEQ